MNLLAVLPFATAVEITGLIEGGALFVVNHSGGKDSQATLIRLLEIVPPAQLLVVHATLGHVEWPGALELAERQAAAAGVPFVVARARKTFLEMVERRFATRPDAPSWPSAKHRQCTSDLKRGPLEREVRRHMKARGLTRVVNCMGMRAAESTARAKLAPFKRHDGNSKAGREWWDWLPIHHLSTRDVFETIARAGQSPHPAYAAGNQRLSCVFCVMGSAADAWTGAVHNPELYAEYVALEERTGYTMHQSRASLVQLTGLTVEQAFAQRRRLPVVREAA